VRKSSTLKNFYTVKNKDQLKKVVQAFSNSLLKVTEAASIRSANRLHSYTLDVIDRQKYNWKPLSQEYKNRKRSKGLDTRILLATKEYRNAIFYNKKDDGIVVVGVPQRLHKDSGLQFNVLARIHEFGSNKVGIPARPLWRPALNWWVNDLNHAAKKEMVINLNRVLKNKVKKIS
jgi:hypothetical protein